eukprot:scaffold14401_cov58-Cyclotella_meneghiniana.AAC.27
MPALYAEYHNKLDCDLKKEQTLKEIIKVGLTYHCNVAHSKGDMAIHGVESRFHGALMGKYSILNIKNHNHHIIQTAVFLANLSHAAMHAKFFSKQENHRANGRGHSWENANAEEELLQALK